MIHLLEQVITSDALNIYEVGDKIIFIFIIFFPYTEHLQTASQLQSTSKTHQASSDYCKQKD